jgi:hypothetical protein
MRSRLAFVIGVVIAFAVGWMCGTTRQVRAESTGITAASVAHYDDQLNAEVLVVKDGRMYWCTWYGQRLKQSGPSGFMGSEAGPSFHCRAAEAEF